MAYYRGMLNSSVNRTLLLTSVFLAVVSIAVNMVYPFFPFLLGEIGIVNADEQLAKTGVIISVFALISGLLGPLWGVMADRFGAGKLLIFCCLISAMAIFSMSMAATFSDVLLSRILQAMFSGANTLIIILAVGTASETQKTSIFGTLSFVNFWAVGLAPTFSSLITRYHSTKTLFAFAGLFYFFATLVFFLYQRKFIFAGSPEKKPRKEEKRGIGEIIRYVTTSGEFVKYASLIILWVSVVQFSSSMITPYFGAIAHTQFLVSTEESEFWAGILAGARGVALAIAGILWPLFLSKYLKRSSLRWLTLLVALSSLGLIFNRTVPGFMAVFAVNSFVIGLSIPLIQSAATEMLQFKGLGLAVGLLSSAIALGSATAPLLSAHLANAYGVHAIIVGFSLALCVLFILTQAVLTIRHED